MKARINKSSGRKQKGTMICLERNINQMSVPEIIRCVPGWIEKDFYTTVETYKDDESITSADILIGMMSDKYLREFPKSAWKHVKEKVASMMNARLKLALDDVIQVECQKRNISEKEAIDQIKRSDDFIKCIFPEDEIPPFYKEKMQETINEYIKEFDAKFNLEEAEELEKLEESEKLEEVAIPEMTKEEQFVENARAFTNNFEFLAEDVKCYLASKGYRDTELQIKQVTGEKTFNIIHAKYPSAKFKTVEDAIRFIKIQEIVRKMMPSDINDEEEAITKILDSLKQKGTVEAHKESNKKDIFRSYKKPQLEGVLENLNINKEETEFINSVLEPICKSRLEVMNRYKNLDNEEVDR